MTEKEAYTLIVPALNFTDDGELIIKAPEKSSMSDFDFLAGKWHVRNRRLLARLSDCDTWDEFEASQEMHKVLQGKGNIDTFITSFDGEKFDGISIRLFNSTSRIWSIYWVDTIGEMLDTPVIGFFENRIGHFFSCGKYNGSDVVTVFRWDVRNPVAPVWSQALSTDKGATWEWNWFMYFTRS